MLEVNDFYLVPSSWCSLNEDTEHYLALSPEIFFVMSIETLRYEIFSGLFSKHEPLL